MPKRSLKCFIIIEIGGYFRFENRIVCIHAVSKQRALQMARELKKSGQLPLRLKVGVKLNDKCDPQSGQPCYYKLLAQPSYGTTPEVEILPNSPEWDLKYGSGGKKNITPKISPRRQEKIDQMHERKDFYG
ncbi:MAG: hypothetical protein Q8P20_10175 [bacterium]|nr:hypothetical protein [bacterium]